MENENPYGLGKIVDLTRACIRGGEEPLPFPKDSLFMKEHPEVRRDELPIKYCCLAIYHRNP